MEMILHPRSVTFARFIDGELSPSQAEKFTAHTKRCSRCAEKLQILESMEPACSTDLAPADSLEDAVICSVEKKTRKTVKHLGEIVTLLGTVNLLRSGDPHFEAFPGMGLMPGDTLQVGDNSRALIFLKDGSSVWLNEKTELSFPYAKHQISLTAGEFFAMMKPQSKGFNIRTPAATLSVLGTDFDTEVTKDRETILKVLKGKVSFRNDSGSVTVGKRRQVKATKRATPASTKIRNPHSVAAWTGDGKKKRTNIMRKRPIRIPIVLLALALAFISIRSVIYLKNVNRPQSYGETYVSQQLALRPEIRTQGVNTAVILPNRLYVYPANDTSIKEYIEKMMAKLRISAPMKSDNEVTEQDLKTSTLIVYGTPQNNSILKDMRDDLPIQIHREGIAVGNNQCIGPDVGVIMVCPNPWNRENRVLVYGGVSPEVVIGINGVFHGPTDYVVFNNKTRSMRKYRHHPADCFLLKGSFDKTDPDNWEVTDELMILPSPEVLKKIKGVMN